MIHSTGVNSSTEASGSKPRSNTKKNRILPAKTKNKKKVEDHPRTNKLFKTYDGESLKAQELCEKVHQDRNNHVGAIMGYRDYMIGDNVVSRAYYVESLGHNLFSVGQFCDSDLEVAFRKPSCFVRNMDGVDLLKGWRSTNLYTISVDEMAPICISLGPEPIMMTPGQLNSGLVSSPVPATT
ncbi:hypothetical protein Tco_1206528, partial [Tanacetum coccineum]